MPRQRRRSDETWKAVLGVGAACAACCAIPLVGGVAALTADTAALAAAGPALLACADEFAPFATGVLVLAVVGGTVTWWARRRRQIRTPGPDVPADPTRCQLGQALPQVARPLPRKSCGCNSGACG